MKSKPANRALRFSQVRQAALNNFYLERIIQTKLQHAATIRYNGYVSLKIATDVRCLLFLSYPFLSLCFSPNFFRNYVKELFC